MLSMATQSAVDRRTGIAGKRCSRCGGVKPAYAFPAAQHHSDGLASWCRECTNAHARAKWPETYAKHAPKARAKSRRYYAEHRDALREKARVAQRERYATNRDAMLAWQAKYRKENPELIRAQRKERYRKNKHKHREKRLAALYGLQPGEFERMLEAQQGRCAICSLPLRPGRATNVDHDHSTGRVRALLCTPCNTAIGFMEDDVDRIYRAAEYVAAHRRPW